MICNYYYETTTTLLAQYYKRGQTWTVRTNPRMLHVFNKIFHNIKHFISNNSLIQFVIVHEHLKSHIIHVIN